MICTTSGLEAQRHTAAKVTWMDINPHAVAIVPKATGIGDDTSNPRSELGN